MRAAAGGQAMSDKKLGTRPIAHHCPACQFPQTKIQRVLGEGKYGSTNYVCSRIECVIGIDLSKLPTWVAV
jgi:hypothetical protein